MFESNPISGPFLGYNAELVQEQLRAFKINNERLHKVLREQLDPLLQKYQAKVLQHLGKKQ